MAEGSEILINATPIGMHPDVGARVPLRTDTLTPGMVVADVIANPPRTRLLQEAAARGCTVLDGLGMLVTQGVVSFRLWTGKDPDSSVMRAACRKSSPGEGGGRPEPETPRAFEAIGVEPALQLRVYWRATAETRHQFPLKLPVTLGPTRAISLYIGPG